MFINFLLGFFSLICCGRGIDNASTQNTISKFSSEYYFYKKNIEQLNLDPKNCSQDINNIITHLEKHNKVAAFELFKSALKKIGTVQKDTFLRLAKWATSNYPDESKQMVQEFIKTNKIRRKSFFEYFFKFDNISVLNDCFPNIITPTVVKQTQTEWHLAKYSNYISNNINDSKLKNILKKIHKKEKSEQVDKKRYVFFHGQRWKWHFAADVFKKLWELKYNEKVGEDFQFLRFISKNESNISRESQKRIRALNGEDNYSRRDERMTKNYSSASRFFMNHALFGNSKRKLASSFYYFTHNYDRFRDNNYMPVKKLFDVLDLSTFYKKYEKKFDRLKILHQKAKTYGNMLLLSFSQEQLKKAVISTNWNGNIKSVYINGLACKSTKKIIDCLKSEDNDISVSTDSFCQSSDSDGLEFCCILTRDCVLNPQSGPRIYSFNTPKKNEFEKYEKFRNEIFMELENDIFIKKNRKIS